MKKFIKKNLFKLVIAFCAIVIISWFYFPEIAGARSGCCSWHGGVCGCSCCDGTPLSAKCAPYYPQCSRSYTPSYPSYTAPSIPSCPSNSYYDSISKSCKCNYGYVVGKDFLGKESCVSGNSYCWDKYGYNSSYNSLNKTCECGYGYIMSGGKCISEDDYCENLYGWHAKYSSLYDKCECDYGYIFGEGLFGDIECINGDTYCHDLYGYHSSYNSLNKKCECGYGYKLINGKCEKKQEENYISGYTPDFLNLSDNNKVCGNNSYLTSDNKCACNSGYVWVDANDSKNLDCKKRIILPSITSIQNSAPQIQNTVINTAVEREKKLFTKKDNNLIKRLKGKILLQVEEHGEAWYIPTDKNEKYYLKDGATAYGMLRKFGMGITNADLAKIPIAESDNKGDVKLVNRLRGKILLQVELNGEAWYVNPTNSKRYYMKDGNDAYKIMRELGLGITNQDVRQIPVGEM